MSRESDVIVVGAGILGCTIAYRLAESGRGVTLIDQRAIGSGCSANAGAIATPIVRDADQLHASVFSQYWYARLRRDHPDVPIQTVAPMYLVDDLSLETFHAQCDTPLTAAAGRPDWLDIPGNSHHLSGPPIHRARLTALCNWLTRNGRGIEVFAGTGPATWRRRADGWVVELPDGRRLSSSELVVATGAWRADTRCTDAVRSKKIVSWHLSRPADGEDPMIYLYDHGAFLLPQPESDQWWLSITSHDWNYPASAQAPAPTADDRVQAEWLLRRFAPKLLSHMRGSSVHSDAYRPSGPGAFRSADGAIVATGGSGSGFRFAPAVAAEALRALTLVPGADLSGVRI